eukprot:Clim_evm34s232 gene=Clim_evmTU34s232
MSAYERGSDASTMDLDPQNGDYAAKTAEHQSPSDMLSPRIKGDFLIGNSLLLSENTWNRLFGGAYNMANSIVGAGVLSMPYLLAGSGLVLGLVIIVLVALITDYSLHLLVRTGHEHKQTTYMDLMKFAFGMHGETLGGLAQLLYAFGAMVAYLIIVGQLCADAMSTTTDNDFWTDRRIWIAFFVLVVQVPLCFKGSVKALELTSVLSMACVITVAIIIGVVGQDANHDYGIDDHIILADWHGVIRAFGISAFSFVCHHNTFLLFNALPNPEVPAFRYVIGIGILASTVISVLYALVGYLAFFGEAQPNILLNFAVGDYPAIEGARILFSLTLALTYPLECFVSVDALDQMFYRGASEMTPTRSRLWTAFLLLSTTLIALFTDNLGIVLELTGSIAGGLLAYVLPAAATLKLVSGTSWNVSKLAPIALLGFGCFIMIGTFIKTVVFSTHY